MNEDFTRLYKKPKLVLDSPRVSIFESLLVAPLRARALFLFLTKNCHPHTNLFLSSPYALSDIMTNLPQVKIKSGYVSFKKAIKYLNDHKLTIEFINNTNLLKNVLDITYDPVAQWADSYIEDIAEAHTRIYMINPWIIQPYESPIPISKLYQLWELGTNENTRYQYKKPSRYAQRKIRRAIKARTNR